MRLSRLETAYTICRNSIQANKGNLFPRLKEVAMTEGIENGNRWVVKARCPKPRKELDNEEEHIKQQSLMRLKKGL